MLISNVTRYRSNLEVIDIFSDWECFHGVMREMMGGLMINNLSAENAWYLRQGDTVLGNCPLEPSYLHLLSRQMAGNTGIVVPEKTRNLEEYVQWMKDNGLLPNDFVVLSPNDCGVNDLPEVYWLAAYYLHVFRKNVEFKTGYRPEKIIWYLPPPATLPEAEGLLELGDKSKFREELARFCPQWGIPTISRAVLPNPETIEEVIRLAFNLNEHPVQEGSTSAVVLQIPTLDGGLGTVVLARRWENGKEIFYKKEGKSLLRFESLNCLAKHLAENEYKLNPNQPVRFIASPFLGTVEISQEEIQLNVQSGSFGIYYCQTKKGLKGFITPVRYQVLEGLSYRGFILDTSSENLPFSEKLEMIRYVQTELAMILTRNIKHLKPGAVVEVNVDFIVDPSGKVRICELNPRSSAVSGSFMVLPLVLSKASEISGNSNLALTDAGHPNAKNGFKLFPEGHFCMYQYDHFVPNLEPQNGTAPTLIEISEYIQSKLDQVGVPVVPFNPKNVKDYLGKDVIYYQFMTAVSETPLMTSVSERPRYKLAVLFVLPRQHLQKIRNFVEG